MISYLSGIPILLKDKLIINVNGIGYGVFVSTKVLSMASNKNIISLFIHTYVKEDKIELYGFESINALYMFELVLGISGIGPKMSLAITQQGSEAIVDAVQQANTAFFQKIPRIGKKMAQKIIIELKSKLGSIKELDLTPMSREQQDIFDALLSLGFEEIMISQIIKEIDLKGKTTQEVIKLAIKRLGNGLAFDKN